MGALHIFVWSSIKTSSVEFIASTAIPAARSQYSGLDFWVTARRSFVSHPALIHRWCWGG